LHKKLLKSSGKPAFRILRQKGSHIYNKIKGNTNNGSKPSSKRNKSDLIRAVIKEAGLKREDFFKLLKEK
jgi:predicted RNA binding protein YcfA (HicA-like mRNA interferase family)